MNLIGPVPIFYFSSGHTDIFAFEADFKNPNYYNAGSDMKFSKEMALQKVKHYCAYQERSHQEVRVKLYSLGLYKNDVEELLSNLISDNYLDEERFAMQYVSGKFRIKKWGKVKIKQALKLKQVSDYNIRKALDSIDEDDYKTVALKLAKLKWKAIKEDQHYVRKFKTMQHLLQKGFERPLINSILAELNESK
ncbi:MAG: RecX family transcriptional regulator [Chitinophagaceae bacterium]|nr:RecX family transcriptional regulator [Chitinophagaceae bacterium]